MGSLDGFPPAPWRLRGEAAIVPVRVRARGPSASAAAAPVELLCAGGWTLGGALLARYDERATLPYHELIIFSGLARASGRPAFVVSHVYVDSRASLRGGREIWGLPKELAAFEWSSRRVSVIQDGRPLLHASFRRRDARLTLPLYAPVLGHLGGTAVRAAGHGRLRGAPALAELDVPETSPFASLGLSGRHLAVAGDDLDLRFPGPSVRDPVSRWMSQAATGPQAPGGRRPS